MTSDTPDWPKDMQPTSKSYAGFRDGKCVAVGIKFSGKRGEAANRRTLLDFSKYDIQTMDHDDACAAMKRDMRP